MLFLYKKLDVKSISMHLVNPDVWFAVADQLIAANGKAFMAGLNRNIPTGPRGYVSHTLVHDIPFEIQIGARHVQCLVSGNIDVRPSEYAAMNCTIGRHVYATHTL